MLLCSNQAALKAQGFVCRMNSLTCQNMLCLGHRQLRKDKQAALLTQKVTLLACASVQQHRKVELNVLNMNIDNSGFLVWLSLLTTPLSSLADLLTSVGIEVYMFRKI